MPRTATATIEPTGRFDGVFLDAIGPQGATRATAIMAPADALVLAGEIVLAARKAERLSNEAGQPFPDGYRRDRYPRREHADALTEAGEQLVTICDA